MIVIASANRSKLAEFKSILPEYDFVLAGDIGLNEDIDETGSNFMENALIKAMAIHKLTDYPVIADDSGLEIDTLNGFPGIFSARFAAPITDYKVKCQLILDEMNGRSNRKACFTCAIVMIMKDGNKYAYQASMPGQIGYEIKGINGFGYDPIFISDGYSITNGEMSQHDKDLISHRGKALRGLFDKLPEKFKRREKQHD